jgi:ElaB/YqjD/DUF883 family membrane-anchored ribosome-binding protein
MHPCPPELTGLAFDRGRLLENPTKRRSYPAAAFIEETIIMESTDIVTRDKLVADLKVVVADAEELLRLTAGQAGEKIAAARDKIQRGLEQAKNKLVELEGKAVEKTKAAARATDVYVHENPWKSVGIAAGAGFLLGWLLGRK